MNVAQDPTVVVGTPSAVYAALFWSVLACGTFVACCWAVKPRDKPTPDYWSVAFRWGIVVGVVIGVLAMALHAPAPWKVN